MKQQLLDDRQMIDYMQSNNIKLKSFMDAQDESFYTMYNIFKKRVYFYLFCFFKFILRKGLIDKRKDYTKMSKVVSSIFDALKYLLLIEPIYYENWSSMKKLLLSQIQVVLKEKGYFLKEQSIVCIFFKK